MKTHPVNHNSVVLTLHVANHPNTLQLRDQVCAVEPRGHVRIQEVVVICISPPCLHFSKVKKMEVSK